VYEQEIVIVDMDQVYEFIKIVFVAGAEVNKGLNEGIRVGQ